MFANYSPGSKNSANDGQELDAIESSQADVVDQYIIQDVWTQRQLGHALMNNWSISQNYSRYLEWMDGIDNNATFNI